MIQRLHDGSEHDRNCTGTHLCDFANSREQKSITAVEDVLPQTGRNILNPVPQCSFHGFWNINALELKLASPEDVNNMFTN